MNGKPLAQAAQSAKQGAIRETQQALATAQSQVMGTDRPPLMPQAPDLEHVSAIGQSNPQLPPQQAGEDIEAYRQQVQQQAEKRMRELKNIIDQEMAQAAQKREQQQQQIAQAQAKQMEEMDKQGEEQGGGVVASLSRAAKRVKGRLGQIMGHGKGEKGKAAKG